MATYSVPSSDPFHALSNTTLSVRLTPSQRPGGAFLPGDSIQGEVVLTGASEGRDVKHKIVIEEIGIQLNWESRNLTNLEYAKGGTISQMLASGREDVLLMPGIPMGGPAVLEASWSFAITLPEKSTQAEESTFDTKGKATSSPSFPAFPTFHSPTHSISYILTAHASLVSPFAAEDGVVDEVLVDDFGFRQSTEKTVVVRKEVLVGTKPPAAGDLEVGEPWSSTVDVIGTEGSLGKLKATIAPPPPHPTSTPLLNLSLHLKYTPSIPTAPSKEKEKKGFLGLGKGKDKTPVAPVPLESFVVKSVRGHVVSKTTGSSPVIFDFIPSDLNISSSHPVLSLSGIDSEVHLDFVNPPEIPEVGSMKAPGICREFFLTLHLTTSLSDTPLAIVEEVPVAFFQPLPPLIPNQTETHLGYDAPPPEMEYAGPPPAVDFDSEAGLSYGGPPPGNPPGY